MDKEELLADFLEHLNCGYYDSIKESELQEEIDTYCYDYTNELRSIDLLEIIEYLEKNGWEVIYSE